MNSGFPFIKIADRAEVTVDLKGRRASGPPLVLRNRPALAAFAIHRLIGLAGKLADN